MRGAVDAMLDRYPEATLQDVYKSMFQDRFGVAHMLGGREDVVAYIEQELRLCDTHREVNDYFEVCGWRGDFVRVNLSVVRDGRMTAEELADMFVQSANLAPRADSLALRAWEVEWRTIVEQCYSRLRVIDDFERDSVYLADLISRGEYVVHHSRRYNKHYAPHYRIVHRSLLSKE